MDSLGDHILHYASTQPEGTPVLAKELLHLAGREAIDQALSRLVRRGQLLRPSRGLYVAPVHTRSGIKAPDADRFVAALAARRGETITASEAAAANKLGLTTQRPQDVVFLTSGPSRSLLLDALSVEMKHAPPWKLVLPGRPGGDAVRALAWLGPDCSAEAVQVLRNRLRPSDLEEVLQTRGRLPTWIAHVLGQVASGTGNVRL